jgi:hypothetical protein
VALEGLLLVGGPEPMAHHPAVIKVVLSHTSRPGIGLEDDDDDRLRREREEDDRIESNVFSPFFSPF